MSQKIFQVDAFANRIFEGNPAAVCVMQTYPNDDILLKIAAENNLAETAYLIRRSPGEYDLRWFTPAAEVDLCGHATLASAHTLYTEYNEEAEVLTFYTRSGELLVKRLDDNRYMMDFPSDVPRLLKSPENVIAILGLTPLEIFEGKDDFLCILSTQKEIEDFKPDFRAIGTLQKRGLIISAPGNDHDFVSRCFYPAYGIDEDPTTGSAHTLLTPYWAHKLKDNRLRAKQISSRGGEVECVYKGERTVLIGGAVTYLRGEIFL